MIARRFIAGLVLGIALGSLGTYLLLTSPVIANVFDVKTMMAPTEINSTKDESYKHPSMVKNNLKYTVLEVRTSDYGIKGEKPLEGGIFLIIKVEIENLDKTEVSIRGKNWFLQDSKGRTYLPKTHNANPLDNEDLFSIRVPPGFKVVRDVGFEIPSYIDENFELYVPNKPLDSEPVVLGKVTKS